MYLVKLINKVNYISFYFFINTVSIAQGYVHAAHVALQDIPSDLCGGGSDQKEPLSKAMLLPVQKATQCPPNKYTQSMLYIRYDNLSTQSLALPWAFQEASRR